MSARQRRLVIVCVDGGLPAVVRRHDFFNLTRLFPAMAGTAVHPLRSIYPSSTAPAHASFLTGVHPAGHGIVGNRFWERESTAEIRRRADDPLSAFHPYESTSLTSPSLLDRLTREGARATAVHFPQTFSRGPGRSVPSCYCLYAPARDLTVPLSPTGTAAADGTVPLSYPGHSLTLPLRLDRQRGTVTLGSGPGRATAVVGGPPTRWDIPAAPDSVSVAVSARQPDPDTVQLNLGTAVIAMGFGGFAFPEGRHGQGPASLHTEYTANPHHGFHESPRAEWVELTALDVLREHDPDVLFVRFNQADHAQEYLYWYAVRGTPVERKRAREQILDVYARIDACAARLAEAVGEEAEFLFFSDHGIDYVETHLRPNRVLTELGLADRMVFQGDSNVAYLYADTPLPAREEARLRRALRALDPSVSVLTAVGRERLRLPVGSPRTGRLTVACGQHTEFQYGEAPGRETVASASHGHLPGDAAMSGFYRCFGRHFARSAVPVDITGAATVVRDVWRRIGRGG